MCSGKCPAFPVGWWRYACKLQGSGAPCQQARAEGKLAGWAGMSLLVGLAARPQHAFNLCTQDCPACTPCCTSRISAYGGKARERARSRAAAAAGGLQVRACKAPLLSHLLFLSRSPVITLPGPLLRLRGTGWTACGSPGSRRTRTIDSRFRRLAADEPRPWARIQLDP